jgi:hypothetical protein
MNTNGTLTTDVTRLDAKLAKTTASCSGLQYVEVAMFSIMKYDK